MCSDAKRRAFRQRIPFKLTPADIDIPKVCPVFGMPLEKGVGNTCDTSPTLDRIIPILGYVPGNVVVVSNKANRIKTNATPNEIYRVARFYEHALKQMY